MRKQQAAPGLPLVLIALFALLKLVLHLLTSSGYGYFRDELYYLASTEHLGWGYVDHPPLSIFVLWVMRGLLGDSLLALRLTPALLGAGTVALVGLMVRRLGGNVWAGILAMTAALVAPIYLALDHFYSMNAFDLLFWNLAAYLLIRIVQEEQPKLWLILGAVLGLGLLNKISVLWLGVGLLVGLLATGQRRWLATRWPWLCGTIAGLLFLPHLSWQVVNGWPTLEFIENATANKMMTVAPVDFFLAQIDMMLYATFPLWLAGLIYFFAHSEGRDYSLLGWIYGTVLVILMLSGASRASYLAAAYGWLFAGGGVVLAGLAARRRWSWLPPLLLVGMVGMGAAAVPLVLPILPVERQIAWAKALGQAPSTEEKKELGQLGQFFADMHGWEELANTVVEVARSLSKGEQARVRVLTPNYGSAGAIDLFGRRQGLAPAISGHNSYWLWGPGDFDGSVLIVLGGSEEALRQTFREVERAATIDCGYCMPYENGAPVWIARGLQAPVSEAWPRVRHYD